MSREKQIEKMAEEILQEYTICYSEADKDVLEKMLNKLVCDVAAEIFELLEKYFKNNERKTGSLSYANFFNLKKKYTESEVE